MLLLFSDDHSVSPTASVGNIALIFDSHLHLLWWGLSVSRACFYHILDVRRIRPVLDFDMAHILAQFRGVVV